ncbi:conserved hypothetical protein [Coccidioides posadasii str. Silveira]|uniref:Uncharacterized protein n=2 Tax=Coccidioides posadasii TaxID=199306 RepID=E9DJ00_COCPS|nr:conserved hypothetical protein [Coccidioides posadasii str. Silveira]KMM65983.1 hypothetical protein CPAG_02324 [Coccidioides posadasii RMSCC 3488]
MHGPDGKVSPETSKTHLAVDWRIPCWVGIGHLERNWRSYLKGIGGMGRRFIRAVLKGGSTTLPEFGCSTEYPRVWLWTDVAPLHLALKLRRLIESFCYGSDLVRASHLGCKVKGPGGD